MSDALLVGGIGGTNIADGIGRIVQDYGPGLGGAPTVRNEADVVPRRFGSIETDSVTGSLIIPVKMVLVGDTGGFPRWTRPSYQSAARALRKLVFNSGRAYTLGRTVDVVGSTLQHQTRARYLRGLEHLEQIAAHAGRVAFELEAFAGYFYDVSQTIITPGTRVIAGDTDTRKLVLDLQSAGTLTNVTRGVSVTVTQPAVLTVEDFTSAGGSIATMSWSGDDYWFVLAPGSNVITWSGGGAATIAYNAAWL